MCYCNKSSSGDFNNNECCSTSTREIILRNLCTVLFVIYSTNKNHALEKEKDAVCKRNVITYSKAIL